MRTVLLDIGPMAHLGGKGSLSGTSATDYELLTSPAGKGIVVNDGVIEEMFVEDGYSDNCESDPFEVSDADSMLGYLRELRKAA